MGISTDQLDAIRFSPFHRLVYVKNQKAGCTSIEYSLWKDCDAKTGQRTFRGRTHDRRSPIRGGMGALRDVDLDSLRAADVFTVVRNPFSRILSAYLHHVYDETLSSRLTRRIGLWRSQDIRQRFYQAIGVDPRRSLSFDEFVEHLVQTPSEGLTGHFRPQVSNVLWGRLEYSFVGRLEEPEPLRAFFTEHGISFKKRSPHGQGADDKIKQFYTDRSVDLIASHFVEDFKTFGYDETDPLSTILKSLPAASEGESLMELLDKVGVV